jgi:MoaA/NifB/PqqE/SkfB family radical SAM enzyme
MVGEKLDIIGFSLAGINEKSDSIRKGTRIQTVRNAIEHITRAKAKYRTDSPNIHIAYMLMRPTLEDLEKIPEFLENTGVSQMVLSTLSLVTCPDLVLETTIVDNITEYEKLTGRLKDLKEVCAGKGTGLHFHLVNPFRKASFCSENIERALVIRANGNVSPCVMTQVPTEGDNTYYYNGKKRRLTPLIFGNISDQPLGEIWYREERLTFIRNFKKGLPTSNCQSCHKRLIDGVV